jgi:hypothetical protein
MPMVMDPNSQHENFIVLNTTQFLNKCSCMTTPEDGFKEAETYIGFFYVLEKPYTGFFKIKCI